MRQTSAKNSNRRAGFTLVELLVCFALLSLLAGIAVAPAIGKQRAKQLLTATTLNLANDLRAARFAAMAEGRTYRVEITATGYTVRASAPVWELIKSIYWPPGIARSGTKKIEFSFPASGIFNAPDNDTVSLKDKYGRMMRVIISSGGRIRLDSK